jgi:CHAT domain-containing protein
MMRRYRAAPEEGRAQGIRTAMLSVMNDARKPEYAQPFFWAPFMLVGEGR